MKILIIDGDPFFAHDLASFLKSKHFQVEIICDGPSGEAYAESGMFDLIIVSPVLPRMDGGELVRKLRSGHCGTPVLMLSSSSSPEDRVRGLNAGVDYYLSIPFTPGELMACIHALLRRQGSQVNPLTFGNTSLDLFSATLRCGERSVRLSAREFDVMRLLFQNPLRNTSKESILNHVWGYDSEAVENHVEVYVGFLRKKLARIGSDIRICAIRRMGYHLERSSEEAPDGEKEPVK
ncbi:MAG: response regulator transcription factor [Clostridia bacterium]